jgi:predicted RNA-binding Zn ribbon-like protein
MTPDMLVQLANLTVPRKPDRGPTIHPDPLASAATAAPALGLPRVTASQLDALRKLHKTVVDLVDDLLAGRPPARAAALLTRLARPSKATVRIEVGENHAFCTRLEWSAPNPAAAIARQVALELADIEPRRLRRCQRAECDLVFYDTTRPGTRLWHAESPCGNRERQRRHREATRNS